MRKTDNKSKSKIPKPIPLDQVTALLYGFNDHPSVFWETVESAWDWRTLRRGGTLSERMVQLDEHFVRLSKTHTVCPIVLLFGASVKNE